jgi:uncharacterized protein YbaA (DUF1428 family)
MYNWLKDKDGIYATIALATVPFWLVAPTLSIVMALGEPASQGDVRDFAYAVAVVAEILVIVLISASGAEEQRQAVERSFNGWRRRRDIVVLAIYVALALAAVALSQTLTRNFGDAVGQAVIDRELKQYVFLDALRVFMIVWTIVIAYRFKPLWDRLVKLMDHATTLNAEGARTVSVQLENPSDFPDRSLS